ncbi:hypothetical protein FGE12_08890 [Aggregicoccus sp. 17bor-14]|uniref:hypothetical protein n=1 Tax=Myxococcaceae TaxID=31 RepID=UPI00129C2DD8|nr:MULTISPECIES: hypothetical protein [Myxococcaceae]MBF5042515.1 hypothetical protein [Simulacricoccus sp. 17bor-14]MRI88285.1 hypothetical protein [Aggregicoccus sp. 17bor-14]
MLRKSLLSGATAALLLSACQPADEGEPFREGLPSTETAAVNVPSVSGQSVNDGRVQAMGGQGQIADLYQLTRGATALVNGGTVAVLTLLEKITDHTPTSVSGDTAVWGPYTDDLAPNTWKLSVTRTADDTYTYALEGKAKAADDSAYVTVLSGTHTVARDGSGARLKHFGSGTFTVDWDKGATLAEHDNNVGSGLFTYSRLAPGAEASVAVKFTQIRDDSGRRVDADYSYKATPRAGGEFVFVQNKNVDANPGLERMTVKSRWQAGGAGRSDVRLSGGDLGAGAFTVSECWDTNFISRYYNAQYPGAPAGYGSEDANCVFTTASYAAALP